MHCSKCFNVLFIIFYLYNNSEVNEYVNEEVYGLRELCEEEGIVVCKVVVVFHAVG